MLVLGFAAGLAAGFPVGLVDGLVLARARTGWRYVDYLERLPQVSQTYLLQCGAPEPRERIAEDIPLQRELPVVADVGIDHAAAQRIGRALPAIR